MTPEMEHIGKILVEAEGGCWHEFVLRQCSVLYNHNYYCKKCDQRIDTVINPDFSEWANFGRLLKIARVKGISIEIEEHPAYENTLAWLRIKDGKSISVKDFDQIPALVATELAKILEEK